MEQASSRPSHGDALNRCLFVELNFLMLPTWGILQTALQQPVDFFEVLFVFSIFGFM